MLPVAVLTDSQTASSGQAIVAAFKGRPHTCSFGPPTYGVPTANQEEQLSDGALMVLTLAVDADRTGHRYDAERAAGPSTQEPGRLCTCGGTGDELRGRPSG